MRRGTISPHFKPFARRTREDAARAKSPGGNGEERSDEQEDGRERRRKIDIGSQKEEGESDGYTERQRGHERKNEKRG